MAQDKLWRAAIYESSDTLFQWTIKAIEDQCPSPQVLKCWRMIENAKFPVCLAAGCSLKHILVGCNSALQQNRYTWRHDLTLYRAVREAVNRGRARLKRALLNNHIKQLLYPVDFCLQLALSKAQAKQLMSPRVRKCTLFRVLRRRSLSQAMTGRFSTT